MTELWHFVQDNGNSMTWVGVGRLPTCWLYSETTHCQPQTFIPSYPSGMGFSRVRLFQTPRSMNQPGPSVHRILQARILQWVAMPSSRELPGTEAMSRASCTGAVISCTAPPGKPLLRYTLHIILREFPGCPVVKTSPSNLKGVGSTPDPGVKIPDAS